MFEHALQCSRVEGAGTAQESQALVDLNTQCFLEDPMKCLACSCDPINTGNLEETGKPGIQAIPGDFLAFAGN